MSCTSTNVRLVPSIQIEPFLTKILSAFGVYSKVKYQLPPVSLMCMQVAVWSTCPCTKCPSMRLLASIHRSKLTKSPVFSWFRLVFSNVSWIAVTMCMLLLWATTVKQTPLWAMLWSIFSSFDRLDFILRCKFCASWFRATTVPMVSMIPVNK